MSTVTRNNMSNFLEPILYTAWDDEFKKYDIMYKKVFNVANSNKNQETIAALTGFAPFSAKTEGNAITSDSYYQSGKTVIVMYTYASMFSVTREMIEDAQYAEAKKNAQNLAFQGKETQETLAWSDFNNGFSATYTGGGFDGKELFATDHPLYGPEGGTEQNELTTAADLTVSSLQECLTTLADTRGDRGERLNLRATKLVVPYSLKFTAGEILTSTLKPYTTNNEVNMLNKEGLDQMTVPYLTDADAFFLVCEKHGLYWFDRRPIDFGSDNVFTTESMQYKSTFRAGHGWCDWRGVFGSPGI